MLNKNKIAVILITLATTSSVSAKEIQVENYVMKMISQSMKVISEKVSSDIKSVVLEDINSFLINEKKKTPNESITVKKTPNKDKDSIELK